MSAEIILSDKAFMGIVLSCIEVYKKECLGILLGYNIPSSKQFIVEYAIPLQSAERKHTEVSIKWRRESKVLDVLPNLIQLEKLGYFHSHPQYGRKKGVAELSEEDIESMNTRELELVVAINDSKRSSWWNESDKGLKGTLGKYRIEIAGFYKRTSDEEVKSYRIVCPYAVGFDQAFS